MPCAGGATGSPPRPRGCARGVVAGPAGCAARKLATLAGISVDYLTRLEQGRATSPSDQVVEALARALRLSDPDREHLFRLAGLTVPGPDLVPTRIPASVQRLLDRSTDVPVAVYDATWTVLQANAVYDALVGPTTTWRGHERNSVWRNLVGPGNRVVQTPDEQAGFEAGIVADLRLTSARYPADRGLRRLVADLRAASPRFAELWDSAAAVPARPPGRRTTIEHPQVGRLTVECDVLTVAADDLRVMVHTAEPGTQDAERLALVTVLGSQALVE